MGLRNAFLHLCFSTCHLSRIFSVRAISPHAFLCLVSLCPFYNVPFVTILTVEDVGPNLGAEGSVR